ncbi:hypothetical protein [Phenylobacterium sp.]|uniref:hypothetical protein n=1 Tax=Phenylobacterium sp. TaxID=1871053 RepID=UPI0025DB6E96|nr:hypothetical protein [Phenylobacterium sp.]MBX3482509.1 hypothetical protein [Phenylobacterium sp.]
MTAAIFVALVMLAQASGRRPIIVEPAEEPVTAGPVRGGVKTFDPSEYLKYAAGGGNSIRGDAFLRTRGGDVRTCAGESVQLVPLTYYTLDWLDHVYGSAASAYVPIASVVERAKTYPLHAGASAFIRTARCNVRGEFEFSGLADGGYAVITRVRWEVLGLSAARGGGEQGGELMNTVFVSRGEAARVTLTQ